MNFYSMKNKFVDAFNQPFCVENDANAIYTVRMMINAEKYPQIIAGDFAFYKVGSFDPKTGTFVHLKKPEVLIDDCSKLLKEASDE